MTRKWRTIDATEYGEVWIDDEETWVVCGERNHWTAHPVNGAFASPIGWHYTWDDDVYAVGDTSTAVMQQVDSNLRDNYSAEPIEYAERGDDF